MARFGLLHGLGFGAWSWDLLRPLLEREGHDTVAVDLPLEDADLATNTAVAEAAIGTGPPDLVVVGHALGCTLLPLVAAATNAAAMVWLCGVIPVRGQSCADQVASDPEMVPMFEGEPYDDGSGSRLAGMAESLFPDCGPETKTWAIEQMHRTEAARPATRSGNVVTEPFPDTDWPDVPVAFILGRSDRALAPDWCRVAARERLGVTPLELDGDHSPLLSRPRELVQMLASFCRSRAIG